MKTALVLIPGFLGLAFAELKWANPSTTCQPLTALGKSSCCVYPTCRTGNIKNFGAMCKDAGLKTYCPKNAVYKSVGSSSSERLDSGEPCDSSGLINWTSYRYNWQCCPCPEGYQAARPAPNCGLFGSEECLRCTLDVERPAYHKKSGTWSCSTSCHETIPPRCSSIPSRPAGRCNLDEKGTDFLKQQEGWCSGFYYAGAPERKLKTIGMLSHCLLYSK
jgi:hypothetical protein